MIALSAAPERDIVLRMLRAGASSYVVKSVPAQDLLTALRATAAEDDLELVVKLDAAEARAERTPASRRGFEASSRDRHSASCSSRSWASRGRAWSESRRSRASTASLARARTSGSWTR